MTHEIMLKPVLTAPFLCALFFLFCSGCTPGESSHQERQWSEINLSDAGLQGTWKMRGYGRLVEVTPDTLIAYHQVNDFCVADGGAIPAFSLYSTNDGADRLSVLYQNYGPESEALQTRIDLDRLDGLPEACTSESTADTSSSNVFDLIWAAFDEHYAFFEEREVDWAQQKNIYRSRVDTAVSDEALFSLLSDMLGVLEDGHVNLYQGRDKAFNAGVGGLALRNRIVEQWRKQGEPGAEGSFVSSWHQQVFGSVYDVLDEGSLQQGAAGALEWGSINGDVAYVRVNRFNGLAGRGVPRPAQLDTLRAALQHMSRDIADKRMAIVDVSLNGGGMDPAAITVARYFADQPRHVLTKEIRGGHATRVLVEPAAGNAFTKPVYLLTSEVTASAAEVFVLMMRAFPHVTHAGGETRGGISGMLPKQLPRNFMVTISNERVLDANGVLYEGQGIPPEQVLHLFPDDSLYTGLASAIRTLAR